MQKEGETAVAAPPAEKSIEEENESQKFGLEEKDERSNLAKWWDYFFKIKQRKKWKWKQQRTKKIRKNRKRHY